jgi:hypothetical protein
MSQSLEPQVRLEPANVTSRPPFLFGTEPNEDDLARSNAWSREDIMDEIGMPCIIPNGRASDYESILSDPFNYFLTRRAGLVPFYQPKLVLTHGSWFHTAGELDNFASPSPQILGYEERLISRLNEIKKEGELAGLAASMLSSYFDTERRAAREALVWYEASCMVPIPNFLDASQGTQTTWRNVLRLNRFRVVARERVLTITVQFGPRTFVFAIQPDLLVYDRMSNSIWPWDWKTTALAPTIRARTITRETQTLLYMHVLSELLRLGILQKELSLPADCTLGPMAHVIIQKPTIKMCGKDRPFTWKDFTPSRGPNKGVTRQEKEYHGEPSHELYLSRCRDWMLGRGDYAHEDQERASEPTVCVSLVRPSILSSPEARSTIASRMSLIADYATRPPIPANFPQTTLFAESTYAPFYTASPLDWPLIAGERCMIPRHRPLAPLGTPAQ